ncbi:MAG: high-potential iron-sulfur protein [Proteobacteria bacterium]|nr:high-potential iron-sulfur protein [Pseudomonadota bacterium]
MGYWEKKCSRRMIIKFMVLSATVPIVNVNGLIGQAQAAKAAKALMKYRDKPNGEEQCSNCMQFISGKTPEVNGECKVVEGSISPHGWCSAYAEKPVVSQFESNVTVFNRH